MDIDALQHVNNARYLNFLEEARISYSQQLLNTYNSIQELNILVARVEIDFMRPILFGEEVQIYTRIAKLGNKSFVFESIITTNANGDENIAAKASQTLVAFDPKTGKTVSINDNLRAKIIKLEPQLERK